jgi:uncharacterized protein YkwD
MNKRPKNIWFYIDGTPIGPSLETQLYNAINGIRKQKGLLPCQLDVNLELAAIKHCNDMFHHNFVSHIGSDGSTFIQRVRRTGREKDPSGEIICKGPGGKDCITSVMRGWLNSPGHRDIMLDPQQRFFGCGIQLKNEKYLGNYWVVIFAIL